MHSKLKWLRKPLSAVLAVTMILGGMLSAQAAPADQAASEEPAASTAAADEMLDDWLDVFLRDHLNEEGEVVGKSTYRWSDRWYETSANESMGEPRETDFWLSAIVFETMNDALEYGTDEAYKEKIEGVMNDLYTSFVESNWHPTWDVDSWVDNSYNDDLCWWSMALLRAYNLTGEEKYFSLAKTLFDELYANGWDETPGFGGEPYGGIKWRRDAGGVVTPIENASKNMCANGNSCLVAARFAQHYEAVGDTENAEYYREVATKIYNWLYAHLYKGDGEVIDNIGYTGNENGAQFTYNYGVAAGAAFEMYNLTGEQQYLDTAVEIMDKAFTKFTSDGLTIVDEGTGDSAGFKTIMLRVAAQMYNSGLEECSQYGEYLVANAYQAWNHRRESDGLVGSNLRFTPKDDNRLCSPCAALGPSLLYWVQFDPNGDYDFNFQGNSIPGRYEAELAYLDNVNTSSSQDGVQPQSGTGYTWYWDADSTHVADGWAEFEVEVPEAGEYNMDVSWYTRGDNSRQLSVNGSENTRIEFTRTNANAWETKTIPVQLNEGKNTIRFTYYNRNTHSGDSDRDSWFFVDYIDIWKEMSAEDAAAELDAYYSALLEKNLYSTDGKTELQGALDAAREAMNGLQGKELYVALCEGKTALDQVATAEIDEIFEDIALDDWFCDEVTFVYQKGIMTGLNEKSFAPYDYLYRAQMALVLYRMSGEEAGEYEPVFPDVEDNMFYTDAVLWAQKAGIVTGYTDVNLFRPGSVISRQEMALMLYRYANYKGYDTGAKADLTQYEDAGAVSGFALDAMEWAVGSGIISGKYEQTQLDPLGSTSRAECAIMISRFFEIYE